MRIRPWMATPLVLLALLAGCGPGSTRSADVSAPPAFVGLQMPDVSTASKQAIDQSVATAARAGAGLLRQPVYWALIEPLPGQYNAAYLDAVVAAAARHHMDVLPMLIGTPGWADPVVVHSGRVNAGGPPADPHTLARFAIHLVLRYGSRGAFWREHPELPRRPIRAWQVWNEPNLPQYWGGHPSAPAYVHMLRVVGRAIHRADPKAEVVSAGVPNSRLGIPFTRWVDEFFAAGAKGTFDAFGLHGYAATVDGVLGAVAQTRAVLRAHGAGDVPIRLTEFGWADSGPLSAFTVSTRTQAFNVSNALTQLAERRHVLGLEGIVYFTLRDGASREEANHGWGFYTGLLSRAGKPKPAYYAFAKAAGAIRTAPGRRSHRG